jgi:hypothetical protein
MAKGMNVELNAQNFPLLATRPIVVGTTLVSYDGSCKPKFVHVANKVATTEDEPGLLNSMDGEFGYICTLYMHAAECLGSFIVATTTLCDWTRGSTCRVFISGTHQLPLVGTLSDQYPEKSGVIKFSLNDVTKSGQLPSRQPKKRKYDGNGSSKKK